MFDQLPNGSGYGRTGWTTPTAIFSVLEVYGELHYVYNINTTYWQT